MDLLAVEVGKDKNNIEHMFFRQQPDSSCFLITIPVQAFAKLILIQDDHISTVPLPMFRLPVLAGGLPDHFPKFLKISHHLPLFFRETRHLGTSSAANVSSQNGYPLLKHCDARGLRRFSGERTAPENLLQSP